MAPLPYPPFDEALLTQAKDELAKSGFTFTTVTLRGALFVNARENTAILLDHRICDPRYPFQYTEYTKEQNQLMHRYRSLYRFKVDSEGELETACDLLHRFRARDFHEGKIASPGGSRELREIDPTLPEARFETVFIECFGHEMLDRVQREFPVIDINGTTRAIDYFIRTTSVDIAVEKNGETYHHPQITGGKKYTSQLLKQNSLTAYGIKVFRWSMEGMKSTENFAEEMRRFFGNPGDFKPAQQISVSRKFKLFKHQKNALADLTHEREAGKSAFLVVLPTGTGKTEILMADFAREYRTGDKALVMVPSRQLKEDHIKKFKERLRAYPRVKGITVGETPEDCDLVVQTYAWLSRYYTQFKGDLFQYVAVDEAHHSLAPTVQKVIQHFSPKTLIGFTATDQRLDEQKLETLFGQYKTDLNLKDAIENGLLAPIKAFRIRSNIDLSQVRFNGKDYLANELQRSVIVPSRDQLIVDLLQKYFVTSKIQRKQGIIFCVSVRHAEALAKRMQDHQINCRAVSGKDKKSTAHIRAYQNGEIQFLTTCSLLNEGWDSPQTSIIVMARPTMSKVLYTQQLGRGTRKSPGREALYVIDVVDNYGGLGTITNRPWSLHALLEISEYLAWGNPLEKEQASTSREELLLAGLYEEERAIESIDIFTFENKYPDHLNTEQLARELFVSTGTVNAWVKKQKITPQVSVPLGRRTIHYFAPGQIDTIRQDLKLKTHDETTQYDDFFEFIEQGDFSMSYKMVMTLSMLKVADNNGECNLDDLLAEYGAFYHGRLKKGLPVDKPNCPYKNEDFLNDTAKM
ncbi:MAG: DEAD/DEAH box helicase, partial [Desulfobacterales bacterium]|nr:DEAD/DEAH box helicase [Desulfobacterales bacterium]